MAVQSFAKQGLSARPLAGPPFATGSQDNENFCFPQARASQEHPKSPAELPLASFPLLLAAPASDAKLARRPERLRASQARAEMLRRVIVSWRTPTSLQDTPTHPDPPHMRDPLLPCEPENTDPMAGGVALPPRSSPIVLNVNLSLTLGEWRWL